MTRARFPTESVCTNPTVRSVYCTPVRVGLVVVAVAASAAGCGSRAHDDAGPPWNDVGAVAVATPPTAVMAALDAAVADPTTAAPTTLPAEPLAAEAPLPEAPPPDPGPVPGLPVVGRLIIPRLGLDTTLYQGLSLDVIDHGPSHWPGTATPGRLGNVVVAGHRVTNTRPFRHLDSLQAGDTATFEVPWGTFTYEFIGHEVVAPTALGITNQKQAYTATLFACHPPGSARQRIVAYFRLVGVPEPGQPDPKSLPPVEWPS